MGVGGAIVGGAIIGGVASDRAASKQASAQKKAGREAIAASTAAEARAAERTEPFRELGTAAAGELRGFLGLPGPGGEPATDGTARTIAEINPVVDFFRQEGFEQIQESAAARGRLGAGDTLKDLIRFEGGLSSTLIPQLEQQRFQQLFNTAGLGSNAASQQATAAIGTGANVSNLLGNIGQAQAAGAAGQGQAITGTIQNLAGAAGAFPGLFGGGGGAGGVVPGALPGGQPFTPGTGASIFQNQTPGGFGSVGGVF